MDKLILLFFAATNLVNSLCTLVTLLIVLVMALALLLAPALILLKHQHVL